MLFPHSRLLSFSTQHFCHFLFRPTLEVLHLFPYFPYQFPVPVPLEAVLQPVKCLGVRISRHQNVAVFEPPAPFKLPCVMHQRKKKQFHDGDLNKIRPGICHVETMAVVYFQPFQPVYLSAQLLQVLVRCCTLVLSSVILNRTLFAWSVLCISSTSWPPAVSFLDRCRQPATLYQVAPWSVILFPAIFHGCVIFGLRSWRRIA